MYPSTAATTIAGLAGLLLASIKVPAPQPEPARWEVTPKLAAEEVAGLVTRADSLRAESRLPEPLVQRQLERYLGRFNRDTLLVRRIGRAVLREAARQQVPVSLITGVLVTENTTLKPAARSSVGARGLMQVMPMHAGAALCGSADLVDVDSNICHGTMVLARNLRATRTTRTALLRYNGCVRGTNTPDCHLYPAKVLQRAGRVRREILSGAAAPPVQLALK